MICYERNIPDQPPLWPDDLPYLRFVLKLHHATRLHHDFRIEAHGTLISWAMDDCPDLDPSRTLWARQMGDHDLEYRLTERRIPQGAYGAGPMLVRDCGVYRPLRKTDGSHSQSVCEGLRRGRLDFELFGLRLQGAFRLQRFGWGWRLRKLQDEYTSKLSAFSDERSILTGRSLEEIR